MSLDPSRSPGGVLPLLLLVPALVLMASGCPSRISDVKKPDDPFPDEPSVDARTDPAADAALAEAESRARAALSDAEARAEAVPLEAPAEVPAPEDPELTPEEARTRAQEAILAEGRAAAIEAYRAVRETHPETTAGQEALYRIGVLQFEGGEDEAAYATLQELLLENPTHPNGVDARVKLGLAAHRLERFEEAYRALSSAAERLEGEAQRRVLEAAALSAAEAGLHEQGLKIALRQVELARSLEAQRDALSRVVDLIDGPVPFITTAELAREVPPDHPAWEVLTWKLARIQYHVREWLPLEETLRTLVERKPEGRFAADASALLARVSRRFEARPGTVGVLLPISGRYQPLGEAMLRGIQLALEGSGLDVRVRDTRGDAMEAVKGLEELVFEEQVMAVIGPLLGESAERVALVAQELRVPTVTFTRDEAVTEAGAYVFRNMLTNREQAQSLARYATEVLGHERFAMLYPDIDYGTDLADAFWDALEAKGAEVRGVERYAHDQTTFSGEVKKLVGRYYLEDREGYEEQKELITEGEGTDYRKRKALEALEKTVTPVIDFDAVFIPDHWRRVSLVAPALAIEDIITNACDPEDLDLIRRTTGKEELHTVTLLGTNEWASPIGRSGLPQLIERGGKFVLCSVYVDGFYADSERSQTRRFVQAYRDRHAELERAPNLLEAYGYDTAGLVRRVLTARERPSGRADVRDALAGIRGYEGATGTIHVDPERQVRRPLFFLTIDKSGLRELAPNQPPDGT